MNRSRAKPPANAIEAWHWLGIEGATAHEAVKVKAGQTLRQPPPLSLCYVGMHASVDIMDALSYAPGPILCRVRLWGAKAEGTDKICAEYRRCDWLVDATPALRRWARWSALRVAHLWAAPPVVLRYLRTGDESIRAAARAAARDAASDAARAEAWAAARVAAWDAQRAELLRLVEMLHRGEEIPLAIGYD